MTETTAPSQTVETLRWGAILRIVVKALALFIILNALYAVVSPLPAIGRISIYNGLVPGRQRLPFGEDPDLAYNFSLYQLDAMFASHVINGRPKPPGEYRVLVIGDSSVWGILLRPSETLAGQINALNLKTADGRRVVAYNLGYPTISVTKDLLILSRSMRYQPDLIVWSVTLEAMPYSQQVSSPIVQNNADEVRALIQSYHLNINPRDPNFVDPTWLDRTIVGQRRDLADVFRLNLYAPMWAATGIDQYYPPSYPPLQKDFDADTTFQQLHPPLTQKDIALDVLSAGAKLAGKTPLILVNEPIFISSGRNSDMRYDFYYPRWAYDDYRELLAGFAPTISSRYLDLWNVVDPSQFTNSAIHVTPSASAQLAKLVGAAVVEQANAPQQPPAP